VTLKKYRRAGGGAQVVECLAGAKPCVQTPVLPSNKKVKNIKFSSIQHKSVICSFCYLINDSSLKIAAFVLKVCFSYPN
jgi:hypothetical protein